MNRFFSRAPAILSYFCCLTPLTFALLSNISHGYELEVGAQVSEQDSAKQVAVRGAYYLDGVNQPTGPRAEAGFLSRASSLYADYADYDDGDRVEAGFEYISPQSGAILDVSFLGGDNDGFATKLGLFVTENSRVTLGFREENEGSQALGIGYKSVWQTARWWAFSANLAQVDVEAQEATYQFGGSTLTQAELIALAQTLSPEQLALLIANIGALPSLISTDEGTAKFTQVDTSVDYYLNDNTSFGVQLLAQSGDRELRQYGLRSSHFFSPTASFSLAIAQQKPENGDAQTLIQLGTLFRL